MNLDSLTLHTKQYKQIKNLNEQQQQQQYHRSLQNLKINSTKFILDGVEINFSLLKRWKYMETKMNGSEYGNIKIGKSKRILNRKH